MRLQMQKHVHGLLERFYKTLKYKDFFRYESLRTLL